MNKSQAINEATNFLISCYDVNNPNDELDCHQRAMQRIDELSKEAKKILKEQWDEFKDIEI